MRKTAATTVNVGTKITHEENDLLASIAAQTRTNRSTVLREAFLWLREDDDFIRHLDENVKTINGRTRGRTTGLWTQ